MYLFGLICLISCTYLGLFGCIRARISFLFTFVRVCFFHLFLLVKMDEDKEKEKELSETSKSEDSIGAFTKELEKLSIDDALECTEEMLEEMEVKANKLEKMLRLKMRMAKMAREEEAWKRSMVVEEESANVSMGVIPATPMGKLFRPSHQAGLTTMFGGDESKLLSEMSSPDASPIMSQVPSPSTKFSSSSSSSSSEGCSLSRYEMRERQ